MSDQPQGPGWWQASDLKWYPPQPPMAPPQANAPQYGAPQQSVPPFGTPQYGTPQYGTPPFQPVGGPPAPKKSKAPWIIGIAVVALLLVGGCVAAVVAATGSVVEEARSNKATVVESTVPGAPATSDDEERPAAGGGTREAPVAIGTDIDLGNGWVVRVDSADVTESANAAVAAADEFNDAPQPGNRYIVVSMTAEFSGTAETTTESPLFGFDASVFGSANVERSSYDNFATPPDPGFDGMSELAAGGIASGNVVFEVGADETDLVLRIEASFTFDETEAWIALG